MKGATKVKKTPKQKFQIFLKVLLVIILIIALLGAIFGTLSSIGLNSNRKFISTMNAVAYENQLTPTIDDDGYYTFVTDDEFKVLQLTDVHIGGGFLSASKDTKALNAVEAMIREEKPDLVVVTGDLAYPVPFQAGTFNNKNSAKLFADMMEQIGVYWCIAFGNHDTESYSYYSREQMGEFYSQDKYEHCLFQSGSEDIYGTGNYVIKVKNTNGELTQALFMIDSNSYTDGDVLGIRWDYDCIHQDQIDWYEQELNRFKEENNGVMPKSLAFFHIPVMEYKDAWNEYLNNNSQDTDNVKYIYGKVGETGEGIYSSEYNNGFFDKVLELGSTQGIFCGHDHLNNFSLEYKGVRLTYGASIDYLAYIGIKNFGSQRGCTIINIEPDGTFDCHVENYYQDKYQPLKEKEEVSMSDMYADE